MILSDDDLVLLTRRHRVSAQVKVLKAIGVPFRQRPDGSIVVFERDLGSSSSQNGRTGREPQLRLSALN